MTLKQLQFFKKTAELENISQAAKELFIAQPALSKAIQELEQELGYLLFDRSGKRITLNQNGEILYKHVLRLQNEFSQMENELREANARASASVNISIRVASKLLPAILSSFYRKYPEANLKIHQLSQTVKSLPEYDVIIDSQPSRHTTVHQDHLLLEERILLAIPASHSLASKKHLRLSDLSGCPCCLLNEFSSLGKLVRNELSSRFFTPNLIFESDNPHMIRDFLELDFAYSFVPEKTWLIKKDFPNLVLREVDDFSCSRSVYLSYGQNEYISQGAREFSKHVRDYFKTEVG